MMIHPPDPDSRRNVHVAMKVSIMTDGPGGLHFTQAVQTGAYSTTTVYPEPFSYQNLAAGVNEGSSANMVTWPRSESSQTQTENVVGVPIIETPVNTSKDSDHTDPRLMTVDVPAKADDGSERTRRSQHHDEQPIKHRHCSHNHHHHHHHRHRRSKSAGSERKSPSSLSSLKPSSSIYTEDINYIYDQFFKLDSVKNMPFTYVDHLGPTFPLLPTNIDLNSQRSIDDPLHGYSAAIYASVDNKPDFLYSNEPIKRSGSDEILINTFSDENNKSNYSRHLQQPTTKRNVILEKEATLKQTLVVRGPDNDVMHKFDNFDKTKSFIGQSGNEVTRVQEIETKNDDLSLLCTPSFDDSKKDIERGVARPLPDIVAVLMEPIVKLTEQLALAKSIINEPYDLKANEEANLEIKTTLSAWKRDLSKKQPIHLKSDDDDDSNLGPPSAPLETLINDVGVESKEIQTMPEKFDISTATESYGTKSPTAAVQKIIEPTTIIRDSPLETLLDDVGVESKQIQTLPEKFHAGTSTDDLILPQPNIRKHPFNTESLSEVSRQLLDKENQHVFLQRKNVPEKIPRSFITQTSAIRDQETQKEESVPMSQHEKYTEINKRDDLVISDLTTSSSITDDGKFRQSNAKDQFPSSRKSKSTITLKPTVPPPLPPQPPLLDFSTNEGASNFKNSRPTPDYGGFVEQQQQQESPNQFRPQLGVSTSSSSRRPASSVEIFQLLTKDVPGKKYGMLGVDSDLYSEHIYETPAFPPLRRDLYTLPELPESPRSDDRRNTGSDKDAKVTDRVTPCHSGDNQSKMLTESNNNDQYSDGYQSINSERSSISGIVKLVDLKSMDTTNLVEENILDYSQEEISPIGKMTEFNESNLGDEETPNRNSLASETSLKADDSFEMYYSEVPKDSYERSATTPITATHSSTPILSLERSFDEIMQMAVGRSSRLSATSNDQHVQRCYPKLYNLSKRPEVDIGGLIDDQEPKITGTRLYYELPMTEETQDTHGPFSESIDQSNSSSSHSTLPLMGDIAVKRNSSLIRTAELVTQNIDHAEMQLLETTDILQHVYISTKSDVTGQIPSNLSVKPLVKRSFKQTSL